MCRIIWYDYVCPLSPITTQEKPYVDEKGTTKKDNPIAPDNQ
jgi:hypothetical protein